MKSILEAASSATHAPPQFTLRKLATATTPDKHPAKCLALSHWSKSCQALLLIIPSFSARTYESSEEVDFELASTGQRVDDRNASCLVVPQELYASILSRPLQSTVQGPQWVCLDYRYIVLPELDEVVHDPVENDDDDENAVREGRSFKVPTGHFFIDKMS